MTDIKEKYRQLLDEVSTTRAMSDEPITRCIGRLTASDVIPQFAAFLQKEQQGGTAPTEILAAIVWFTATVFVSFTDKLPPDQRHAVLLDLSSKLLATCLGFEDTREGNRDGE